MSYFRTDSTRNTSEFVSVGNWMSAMPVLLTLQSNEGPIEPVSDYGVAISGPLTIKLDSLADRTLTIPISVVLRPVDGDEFLASFEEADIATTGLSATDALDALKSAIVEIYEMFRGEPQLGPGPKRELTILEKYLGRQRREQVAAPRSRANR